MSYAPLWRMMEKRGAATYTLQVKGGISSSTIRRLKAGDSVSTNTLEALCKILDCTIQDVIEYLPDEKSQKALYSRQKRWDAEKYKVMI